MKHAPDNHPISRHWKLRMVAVAVVTILAYTSILWITNLLKNQANLLAEAWTGAWTIGLIFATWNTRSSIVTLSAVTHGIRAHTNRLWISARWMARNDLLKAGSCWCMATAGFVAMLHIDSSVLLPILLLAGGIMSAINVVMDRIDRDILMEGLARETD